MQAKLHAAGTTVLLAACLGVALIAVDSEIVILRTAPTVSSPSIPLVTDAHPRAGHHMAISTIILAGRRTISVPILLYHYVQDTTSKASRLTYNLSVSIKDFTEQMDWLAAHDYHPVTMEDLDAYFTKRAPLPGKPVVITLDDGYRDLYTNAFPILKAHGFSAVAYIVSGFVGEPRYVTAAMIQEMDANGIEIASHTVNHPNLTRTSPPLVDYELDESKSWLENLVGAPVVDFAYPSGRFDASVISQVEKAGYLSAVTEIGGTYHSWADRFEWSRVRVSGGETLTTFIFGLGPVEPYITVQPAAS